jgi:pyruvate kinase
MTDHPRPTRAEASDAANAVLDGSDALMLSGETAAGQYPVQALEALVRIATEIEGSGVLERGPRYLTRMAASALSASTALFVARATMYMPKNGAACCGASVDASR